MLDTSTWPIVELDVLKDIRLDPKNVRLEIADAKVEADIIEDLFVNEDALGLVEGICKIGYLTHETPVVLDRQGKYVMVEGNRRLAALKSIQNPMLVPDYQARISALAKQLPDRSSLAKIRVMIAPSQDEADQLIAAIHTGNLRRAWTPSRQAAFFQAQIDSGRTLNELVSRYPTIDVTKFVRRALFINLFKSVQFDDPELQDFLNTKKWARGLSTLARIYESKEFVELIGLTMQSDGTLSKIVSDEVFKEVATEIVRGMFEENINTRSLNSVKSPRYTQLMAELRRIVASAPDTQLAGSSSGDPDHTVGAGANLGVAPSGGDGSSSAARATGSGSSPTANTSRTKSPARNSPVKKKAKPRNLDLGQVKAPDAYPEALKLLLGELSEVDVQKFPNVTFLAIRAVLEKSIKAFAEYKTIDIGKTKHNNKGRVQLGNALSWLLDHVNTNGPSHLKQPIKGVQTGFLVTYTSTADSLNAVNHNHHFNVDRDQAFAMWSSIDSIMRYLMKP